MQRRARIKAVANLSSSRRSSTKAKSEIHSDTSKVANEPEASPQVGSENVHTDKAISTSARTHKTFEVEAAVANNAPKHDNVAEFNKAEQISENTTLHHQISTKEECTTFKAPLQLPRLENDSSLPPNSLPLKMRRFKVAPRLSSRCFQKPQEVNDDLERNFDGNTESSVVEAELFSDAALAQINRPLTPALDHPGFSVQYPGAPASPFPYASFSSNRIRTESLCSIKSNREVTVANLQPRKNIRTEDQKIIDIKRESRERLSNKDLDKSQLRMFDMIYFNPQNNPMKPKTSPTKTERPKKIEIVEEVPAIKQEPPASMPVPQLRLNANGEMVLDEASLVVENEQQKQNRILLANTNVVYDDDLSANYGFYKRQKRTREWSQEETVKFYRCLNTVGTDFSLMLNLFPNRSRRDIKLKFKKEEKQNPALINKALLKFNTFDLEKLQRELAEEEAERKRESEAKSNSEVKELVKRKILKKQEAKLKPQEPFKSKVEKCLVDGQLAFSIVDNKLEQQDLKENLEILAIAPKKRQYKRKAVAVTTSVMDYFNTATSTATSASVIGNLGEALNTSAVDDNIRTSSRVVEPPPSKPCKDNQEGSSRPNNIETNSIQMKVENICSYEKPDDTNQLLFQCKTEVVEVPRIDPSALQAEEQRDEIPTTSNFGVRKAGGNFLCNSVSTNQCNEPIPTPNPLIGSENQNANSEVDKVSEAEVLIPTASDKHEKKVKARKRKFKPMLVKRLKLDDNGDMVPDESTAAEQSAQEEIQPTEEIEIPAAILESIENDLVMSDFMEAEKQVAVNENPIEPSQNEFEFDGDAFLNSLDLEKLVLVQAQRDGKDVYEIHEIDPVTKDILEKPMDLPARYVDLIISIMTQPDDG